MHECGFLLLNLISSLGHICEHVQPLVSLGALKSAFCLMNEFTRKVRSVVTVKITPAASSHATKLQQYSRLAFYNVHKVINLQRGLGTQ